MALSDDQVAQICNAEFENSIGIPSGDVNHERALAYDYYLRKQYGDEEEGLSKVVTSEVADIVDGTLSSLIRIFSYADNLVMFEPEGPNDIEQSQQESNYLTYLFFKRNPAFEILFNWGFDGLVQKNGYVKCYWDTREYTTTEHYEGLTEIEVLELLNDEELEPVERETRTGTYADPMTGQLVEGEVHDIKFERTTTKGRITVENVPPEQLRVSKDCRSLDPGSGRMVAQERDNLTRDDLRAMGFSEAKIKKIPADWPQIDSTVKSARRDKTDDQNNASSVQDKSQEYVTLREVYMKIDVNEDGRAEYKQVFIANGELIEMNDADRQPFHAFCPSPLPHKHIGQSQAEKVMDLQRVGSTLTRQTLDNLYHTNNPGKIIWEQAMGEHTMQDALTRRIGRHIRVRRPVDEAIRDDAVPFMAKDSFAMLEWIDRKKTERTGIGFDSEGLTPDSLKNIQISVMAEANDIKRMKVETVARIWAETGIKSLFLHMHELVLKYQQDADVFRLNDSFVPVNPKEWRTRYDMTAVIGLGIANRDRNLLHLNSLWEKQMQLGEMLQGKLVVKPKHVFNTLTEIVKNANIGKPPEMFAEDPGDETAPPPTDEQMELQKQQLQVQQQAEQNKAMKNQLDQQEIQIKAQKMQADSRMEMAKLMEQREARFDKLHLANEELRNRLAEMGHEIRKDQATLLIDEMVKRAQADESAARATEARARAASILKEANTEVSDLEIAEAMAKIDKLRADTDKVKADTSKTEAEVDQIDATIDKTERETEAVDVEIDAARKGINEMLDDGEESSGTE